MSTLQLDRSDHGVDEMVAAWKDGGEYQVMLRITQKSSSPNVANFDVMEVVNESEGEEPAEEAAEEMQPGMMSERMGSSSPMKKSAKPPVEVTY